MVRRASSYLADQGLNLGSHPPSPEGCATSSEGAPPHPRSTPLTGGLGVPTKKKTKNYVVERNPIIKTLCYVWEMEKRKRRNHTLRYY